MKRQLPRLLMLATAGLAIAGARAQDAGPQGTGLEVTAWSIDGGGGRATGSRYVLFGSAGQADAEPLHPAGGGSYSLVGGFLPAATPDNAEADPLFADGFEG